MAVAALPEETVVVGASGLVSASGEVDVVGATANEVSELNQGNREIEMEVVVVGADDGVGPIEAEAVELRRGLIDMVLLGMGKVAVGVTEGAEVMVEDEHPVPKRPQSEGVGVVEGGAVDEGPQPTPNKPQSDDVDV